MRKIVLYILLLFIVVEKTNAQRVYLPLNNLYGKAVEGALYSNSVLFHTSVKPCSVKDVNKIINYDSIINTQRLKKEFSVKWKQKAWDKLFNDNVVTFHAKHFGLFVNPLMEFSFGKDFVDNKKIWVNTRGIEIFGNIEKNITYYTSFYENQAVFTKYVDDWIRKNRVVPGQGVRRNFNNGGFDYSNVTGYLNFNAGKYFVFQFGHGKNFIGDGYRSLLLSDVSFPNAFLKVVLNVWHIKYMVLYNQYIDIRSNIPEIGYPRKYSTVHYLSWTISKRVNLSLFDAIVWQATDTLGNYRGFDIQYLNPIIFLRPVEFSVGSPDNALIGLNLSVIVGKHNVLYGQAAIDEFTLHEVLAGNGYWANKQAFQIGFKTYNPFSINGLYFQTEFNYVPPYTYSERIERTNYGHYNQPIAHPFGANFWESVSFVNYNIGRFYLSYEFLYSIKGFDPPGMNYGGDIYKSYNTRVSDYGNFVGQGIKTKLLYQNLNVSYLINPAYNLNVVAGMVLRNLDSEGDKEKTQCFYFGLRTSLRNLYYDF